MSLANTLSVLLNFKADSSGLKTFQSFLNGHVKQVEEFNAKLQNGTAALNNALQAGAAYLGVQALSDYSREAIQARQTQGQLSQALKQTKQDSAEYRAELQAQASEQQRLTGLEDDQIAAVQRQLVFAKVQRKDMAELTRLTLDFAAAKEIDAVSAAKAVGRAVQGEGDELARYGVAVDLAKDKITALREGLGKFSGQSATAFSALPPGLREFSVASKEGKQTFGELVLELANPLLKGFADAINRGTESLNRMSTEGSVTITILSGVAQTIGPVIGVLGDKVVLLVASLLALKAASMLASQGLALVASGFAALTRGGNIAQIIVNVQELSKEIGILKALSTGGWTAMLASGILAIGVGLAALGVGSVVIKSIEAAQLARLEREEKIREAITGQTRALVQQASAAKTTGDVEQARKSARERVTTTRDRITQLEGMVEDRVITATDSGTMVTDRVSTRTAEQEAELQGLRAELPIRERSLAYIESQAFAEAAYANAAKDSTKAVADRNKEQRSARDELDTRTRMFDLETAIKEAEADHNDALVEKLTRERDELNLLQQLGPTAYEQIQARLDLEAELRDKQLQREQTQRDIFALETQVTAAEAAGNVKLADSIREQIQAKQLTMEDERRSAADIERRIAADRALAEYHAKIAADEQRYTEAANRLAQQKADIENNALLTEREKTAQLLQLNQQLIALIEARKTAISAQVAGANDETKVQLQAKIDELNSTIAQLRGESTKLTTTPSMLDQQRLANKDLSDPSKHYQSASDGIQGGAIGTLNSLGTAADDAASTVSDTLNAGLSQTQGILFNLSQGAGNFRDMWNGAIQNVQAQFFQSATMMVAKAIWRATIERGLTAMGVTLHVGGEQAKTGATLLGGAKRLAMTAKEALADVFHGAVAAFKALASIPYVGPILGAAAMAAALAGGMALVKNIAGHKDGAIIRGPGTSRSDSILARLSNGEAVINAPGTSMLGEPFINAVNAGRFDVSKLPARLLAGMSLPSTDSGSARSMSAARSGSRAQQMLDAQSAAPAGGFHGNVIVAMGEDYLHDAMASSTGNTIILRSTSRDRRAMGIRT